MKALILAAETTKASDLPAKPKGRATKRVHKPALVTATPARKGTKGARIIALLQKPSGASLKGLMAYASYCTSLA